MLAKLGSMMNQVHARRPLHRRPPSRQQVYEQLPAALKKRVHDMEQALASGSAAETDRIKDEIDDVIAGECVLCGSAMIKSIDVPFTVDQSDWAL
jgi:hypothetical protein